MPRPSVPLLSRETIVARALAIVDELGASGLSVRRLAADLGVSGPSLYHHFGSKDEILDAIIEFIYQQIHLETGGGTDWEGVLASYAYQLRALLITHPHVVEFLALHPVNKDPGLRIYDHLTAQLLACGWDVKLAGKVLMAVENLVFGAALMANAPPVGLTREQQADYPALTRLISGSPSEPKADGFDLGFKALIAGFKSEVLDQTRLGDRAIVP